jgi:MFS family permease
MAPTPGGGGGGSDSGGPPDGGGAAWGRVLALWFCCAGTLGLQYAFGALFVDLLEDFGGSRGATAAVGGICVGIMDLGAVGAGLVMARVGERRCCLMGAVLTSIGLLSSSYAHSLGVLYLTWGVLVGSGMALSLFAGVVCVNKWFSSKRAVASGIGNTGAAVGPFLFGALWSVMTASYGWRGTLRMLAASDLVLLCGAALWLTDPPLAAHTAVAAPAAAPAATAVEAVVIEVVVPATPDDDEKEQQQQDKHEATEAEADAATLAAVWRLPQIRQLCLAIFLMGLGVWVPAVHLIQFARDRGFSDSEAEALLMMLAVGSTVLRVPLTYLADRLGRKRVFTTVLLAYVCADIFLVVMADHYAVLLIYSTLVGGLIGCLLSLMPTLPAEEVPPHQIVQGTTIVCSSLGLGTSTGPMLAGAMFDAFGTYTYSFLFAATALLAAAVTLNVRCACFAPREAATRRGSSGGGGTQQQEP